jgi:ornithine cyclodeaminase
MNRNDSLLILDFKTVLDCFDLKTMMATLKGSLIDLARHRAFSPPRRVLLLRAEPFQAMGYMPGFETGGMVGAKLASINASGRLLGIDCHQGLVSLFCPETGRLLCLADGAAVTALRTATVSALAASHLARADSRTLAIIGTGAQAELQSLFLSSLFPIQVVYICSANPKRRGELVQKLRMRLNVSVRVLEDIDQAEITPDIICTVTDASKIVLSDAAPSVHINAMGACTLQHREIAPSLVNKASLFVETLASARGEAGDLAQAENQAMIELGSILEKPYCREEDEITLFKSVGIGLMDVSFTHLIYDKARAGDRGQLVTFGSHKIGIDDIQSF